jgi:DivIVA domain-containing protein
VTIEPADIEAQEFPLAFRGYKVEAVDTFLDHLQAELAQTLAEHAARIDPAGHAAAEAPGPGTDTSSATDADQLTDGWPGHAARAVRTLVRAEEMAEQMTAEATAQADEILARAQVEAGTIIAAAHAERGRIDAESNLRRHQEVSALVVRTQHLQAEIDRLAGLERQYREALHALLSEQQRLLEQRLPVLDAETADGGTSAADELRPAA